MEFILEQQARLTQQIEDNAKQSSVMTQQIDVIAKATHVLLRGHEELRLVVNENSQNIRELIEDVRMVNDSVGALVKVVDGLVRRGNGHQPA
jgi:uncharacterized protein YoxC